MRTVQETLNAVIDNGHYMPELSYMCNALFAARRARDITEDEFLAASGIVSEFVEYLASMAGGGTNCLYIVLKRLYPESKLVEHWYDGGGVWFYQNFHKREAIMTGEVEYVQR